GGGTAVTSFVFFPAEDGIRAFHVTGVQTCALPICLQKHRACCYLILFSGWSYLFSRPVERILQSALLSRPPHRRCWPAYSVSHRRPGVLRRCRQRMVTASGCPPARRRQTTIRHNSGFVFLPCKKPCGPGETAGLIW